MAAASPLFLIFLISSFTFLSKKLAGRSSGKALEKRAAQRRSYTQHLPT